ncbi:MAG: methyltransferase [Thermodesulfobacteriota bacterium]|nr:MAG: methyltransferase [Thermodesulfobacteriota bacterium]
MRRQNISAENELEVNLKFLTQFLIHPTKIGAIAPSNNKLCDMITDMAELDKISTVIEFGSGTGVITEKIVNKVSKDTTFFAMEINETLVEATKNRCPDATVYLSSASDAKKYLEIHGENGCDRIISSLPWSTFSDNLQDDLMETVMDVLNPGGKFLTYAYVPGLVFPSAIRFRKKLNEKFDKVSRSKIVWTNFPPAFIYYAEKT